MLLNKMIYFDGVFIFLTFLCIMSYVKDKRKIHLRNHLIGTSFLYVIYLILDIDILPELLSIGYGFEIFIFRALIFIELVVFIIMSRPPKKVGNIDDSLKDRKVSKKENNTLIALIIIPIILFCVPLFRELYFINNSKVVLVFQEGSGFDASYYGYAINNKYCEKISIGASGISMDKYLPQGFNVLFRDEGKNLVSIENHHIIVYGINKEIIYEGNIDEKVSASSLKNIFYR